MSRQNMIPQSPFVLRVASVAQVPGLAGASAALQAQFNALPVGSVVTEDATYKVYVKSDARPYALGGRIQPVSTGVGIPNTPAAVLLDAASPNTVVALNASGVGTSVPATSLFDVPLPLTSFTASQGIGTADTATGTLTVPIAPQLADTFAKTPYFAIVPGGDTFNFQCTMRIVSFTNGNVNQSIVLSAGWNNASFAGLVTNSLITVGVGGDASFAAYAGDATVIASGGAGTLSFDGQDWLRVSYARGWTYVSRGRGTSAANAVWTVLATIRTNAGSVASNTRQWLGISLISTTVAPVNVVTAVVSDVTWKNLV